MKVLITGGGGFVGSTLADRLLGDGHEVLVIDNYATGRRDNLTERDGLQIVEATIADADAVQRTFSEFGPDHVVHAAASYKDPDNWAEDAARRDFTINALYASLGGEIFDYATGVEDLAVGRVRFVGDARTRIAEDTLRVLRLFRFHAWYGKGDLDTEALRAAAEAKSKLKTLSGERIAKELLRLLEAGNPALVLRVMAATGILSELCRACCSLPAWNG